MAEAASSIFGGVFAAFASRFCTAEEQVAYAPEHSVRTSARARRISLRVLPGKGLEVVLPPGADPARVPEVLQRHRQWIEKHLGRLRESQPPAGARRAPHEFALLGGRELIRLAYKNTNPQALAEKRKQPGPLTDPAPGIRSLYLPFSPDKDAPALIARALREWLREEARSRLGTQLHSLALAHGFHYTRLSIRYQKSRWGSCSSKGGISLNACLMFLPARLIRHILLHELCHTRVMNHGQAFWKELFALESDALDRDREMRRAWKHVPAWVFME
ncbi:M48 family metallopeptidase [Desulfovibrio sp. OttesenSCG-928-A18]|nr:M48 family metallopeptidase [Desulfovibrio sp. OttesenSCG-928-A18]